MFEAHENAKRIAKELSEAGFKSESMYGNVKVLGSDVAVSVYLDGANAWRLYGDKAIQMPKRKLNESLIDDVRSLLERK